MYQFEKLDIWQDSLKVVRLSYAITKGFPKDEQYSLSNQIQRAAISISLNIAEGRGSDSQKDFAKYLNIALKSLYEVVAALKISIELGYLTEDDSVYLGLSKELDSLGARIRSLINKINKE